MFSDAAQITGGEPVYLGLILLCILMRFDLLPKNEQKNEQAAKWQYQNPLIFQAFSEAHNLQKMGKRTKRTGP